jgi:SPP1 family predicted phage head-tail adaptor
MASIGTKSGRVVIQKVTETGDGQGGKTKTYSTRCKVWANERPLNGREALLAAQVTAVLSTVWEIWFRSDISAKDRILDGARIVEIESYYDPDGRSRELYLVCSEVQT